MRIMICGLLTFAVSGTALAQREPNSSPSRIQGRLGKRTSTSVPRLSVNVIRAEPAQALRGHVTSTYPSADEVKACDRYWFGRSADRDRETERIGVDPCTP